LNHISIPRIIEQLQSDWIEDTGVDQRYKNDTHYYVLGNTIIATIEPQDETRLDHIINNLRSYWTTPDTSLGVDVGTSANNTFLAAGPLPPNQKLEVDTNEGPSTLAVVLQFEGVVNLAGITAALKLPVGFKALFPLAVDRTNFDIALSSYRGHIYPGQGIVLYFSVNVLPTAKVQLPVLGPLALHFLRSDQRSILDSLSDQSNFARALSFTNTTFFDPTTFHSNFDHVPGWIFWLWSTSFQKRLIAPSISNISLTK
jgi:hypothetical protein